MNEKKTLLPVKIELDRLNPSRLRSFEKVSRPIKRLSSNGNQAELRRKSVTMHTSRDNSADGYVTES